MFEKIAQMFGGSVIGGLKDLIQTFKLPPEVQLKAEQRLAEIEHEFLMKSMELDFQDRDSARRREMEVKDSTPAVLVYSMSAIMVLGMVYFNTYPPAEAVKGIVDDVMMAVRDGWLVAIAYYFGSSNKQFRMK